MHAATAILYAVVKFLCAAVASFAQLGNKSGTYNVTCPHKTVGLVYTDRLIRVSSAIFVLN